MILLINIVLTDIEILELWGYGNNARILLFFFQTHKLVLESYIQVCIFNPTSQDNCFCVQQNNSWIHMK